MRAAVNVAIGFCIERANLDALSRARGGFPQMKQRIRRVVVCDNMTMLQDDQCGSG